MTLDELKTEVEKLNILLSDPQFGLMSWSMCLNGRMNAICGAWIKSIDRDTIVKEVQNNFRTFGGGKSSDWNPVAAALSERNLCFAAGVDVKEVVDFIIWNIINV